VIRSGQSGPERYQFESKSNQTRCPHLLLHSLLLIEELRPQDSRIPQTGIHYWDHTFLLVVVQQQAPRNPLLLKVGCLHIVELPLPLQLPGDHQIPDVEIFEAFPLLLSVGLDVGQGGVGLGDVSPPVGILLLVEGDRLLLVFQRSTRKASGTRRWDVMTSSGDMTRRNSIGSREDAVTY